MNLLFLPDRYPKAELKQKYARIHECLDEKGILGSKDELLRFVGFVHSGSDECVMFLPHGAPHDLAIEGEAFAKEVMAAITKFARQNSRKGEDELGDPTLSFAALVSAIAEDFRDHGLFSERLRAISNNSGKPNWPATVKGQISLIARNGAPVYSDISTTRPISSSLNILAMVQAAVVREIHKFHKWWLIDNFGKRQIPFDVEEPRWPREAWSRMLRGIRQNLFAERPLRLVAILIAYLDRAPESSAGALVCGISDFSTVWETMLKKVIPGVDEGWNKHLPDPKYIPINGVPQPSGGMRTDMVIKHSDHVIIADAKYYIAESTRTAPHWDDIVKQFYYLEALASVAGAPPRDKIGNCFIFPITDGEKGQLERVEMFDKYDQPVNLFPSIECIYLGVRVVILAYSRNELVAPISAKN